MGKPELAQPWHDEGLAAYLDSDRNGRYPAAVAEIKKALSGSWQDAHLFFHAAMIHLAAGLTEEGKGCLRKAGQLNPHYDAFHVHR